MIMKVLKPSDLVQLPVESEIMAFNEFIKANWDGKSVNYKGELSPTTVLCLKENGWNVYRVEPCNHEYFDPYWKITENKPTHHKKDE